MNGQLRLVWLAVEYNGGHHIIVLVHRANAIGNEQTFASFENRAAGFLTEAAFVEECVDRMNSGVAGSVRTLFGHECCDRHECCTRLRRE
ncbi:MAG: hypothetical protein JST22_15255 [Bacteroidetes bacterium]|nr:hypothetical protein [Bacteroidota bacterium]